VYEDGVTEGDGVAWGSYSDASNHPSYFGQLRIKTSDKHPDIEQMRAAGFMEGVLTHKRINDHVTNVMAWVKEQTDDLEPIKRWMEAQDEWAHRMAKENTTAFWQHGALILAQLDGLVDGYLSVAPVETAFTRMDLILVNGLGDLLDLIPALNPKARPDWNNMTAPLMLATLSRSGHCSALIKVNGDLTDIVFSHSSWFIYAGMNRIYKHYSFALTDTEVTASNRSSFSSYPGVLSSLDDFYLMDKDGSALVMLQTTNSVMDPTAYEGNVDPHSMLAWQRVRIANQMASNGREWADVIDTYNSGTYNNQYMVLDLKRFDPGKPLRTGLLWVVEQMPGLVARADTTDQLERGYWPSYNVPYFREVYDRSGYEQMLAKHSSRGEDYKSATEGLDYQLAPRAKIFRRDTGGVESVEDLKKIMRYNGWPLDPYAGGSPFGAICSRGDLDSHHPAPDGCYDTKVSSYLMAQTMEAEAVNGPTTDGQQPFTWSAPQFKNITHQGLPDIFNFRFEREAPSWEEWEAFLFTPMQAQMQ